MLNNPNKLSFKCFVSNTKCEYKKTYFQKKKIPPGRVMSSHNSVITQNKKLFFKNYYAI